MLIFVPMFVFMFKCKLMVYAKQCLVEKKQVSRIKASEAVALSMYLRKKTERKLSLHELCADCLKLAQASVSIVQFEGVTMRGLEFMGNIVQWGLGKL